jgi:small subunit ribosomal protein S2
MLQKKSKIRNNVRNLCKILLKKAYKTFISKRRNKKKIKYLRARVRKKFSLIYYKNRAKNQLKLLMCNLSLAKIKLDRTRGVKFFKFFKQSDKAQINRGQRKKNDNYKVSLANRKAFFFRKKKKKLRRKRMTRKISFYSKFPKELKCNQPLIRFYRMNLEMLNLNYDLLLSFHAAIGNSYKTWKNPAVFSSILAIRNDMILFDLSMIFLRLKKGLQKIFQISKHRGSILGFVDLNKNYKFSGRGFDHFLRSWLAGYLTNYKYVMKNLRALKTKKFMSLTRRQKKFFQSLVTQKEVSIKFYYRFFKIKRAFRFKGIPKNKKRRIPAVPQFGFSLEDHNIWLNESHKIGNSVMAVCDSESFPQQVDFPLIANQKSLPLSFFLVKVITESISCGKRMDYFSFIGFNYVAKYLR